MAATDGLEKFSHLEDKIYRTIEVTKALRQEKDDLGRQLASARNVAGGKADLAAQIEHLIAECEAIRSKVQGMLDAVADSELGEAIQPLTEMQPVSTDIWKR